MSTWFFVIVQISVITYAFVGGVFLAFSDFIMQSLAHRSGSGGIEVMQIINREVFRWVFMTLFIGMTPVSLLIMFYGGVFIGDTTSALMMIAGMIYLVGCFAVTVFRNVPMNEALADMDADLKATHKYWKNTYLRYWTLWNTVRTTACALSAGLLLAASVLFNQA